MPPTHAGRGDEVPSRTRLRGRAGTAAALAFGLSLAPAFAQRGDAFNTPLRPPAEQQALFRVPAGFEVQLIAAEPQIQKPFNLAFDGAGRVWVTGSTLYPWPARRDALGEPIAAFEKQWEDNAIAFRAAATPPPPPEHGADTVRILSDFGPDGRARKITVFADGLNIPIGVLPLAREAGAKGDTALVFSIPAIWRLADTDGDGRADRREKLYDGFGFKDTHGMSSSYWLWFDGWVYGTHGFSNLSEVRDRRGRVTRMASGHTYRFRPDGSEFQVFTRGQTNPFGLAFDARGDVYTADSHSKPVYLLVPGGGYEGLGLQHDGLGFGPPITLDNHGSTAIAGIAHYSAAHYPPEYRGSVFNGNPVTRRINRARLDWRGSTPAAIRQADFVSCDDAAFRPVQVKLGPDGALWIADFYNPIIGHYEVPLTHPARNQTHGRIWRIVWRGLDGAVPAPVLPDLTASRTSELATRLADPNLMVRSLALTELVSRGDAAVAGPVLREAVRKLMAGGGDGADETAALPMLMALDRLGLGEDRLITQAFQRPDSEVTIAALRTLAARNSLPAEAESRLTTLLDGNVSEHAIRAAAEVFRRHPQPWQAPLMFRLLAKAPPADAELVYALRVSLKSHALAADTATLKAWAGADAATADRLAEICLAVPTGAAAEFLASYLERTKFRHPQAGDLARHVALHLPASNLTALLPLMHSLRAAPSAQRVALAEGLALMAGKRNRELPEELHAWMTAELIGAFDDADGTVAYRAIVAVKDLAIAEKAQPLRAMAVKRGVSDRTRTAALRSLEPRTEATEAVLVEVLAGANSNALRKVAAELLGAAPSTAQSRAALTAALTTASADLTLSLATALAKSREGAAHLVQLAEEGRIKPTLLKHRYVAAGLAPHAGALEERITALTRALPPEDARLDAVIAQRVAAALTFNSDRGRGAAVFAQHCAACHRVKSTGGTLGPNLDGIASRGMPRLIEDILDPSRNIDPAFRLTTVILKTGETKSGFNRREQSDGVTLTEPATGHDFTVPSAQISEIAPSPASAMPGTYEATLTEQEFFDVLHFLRNPT